MIEELTVLFPCLPFNLKKIDPDLRFEYGAAETIGFKTGLFDHDELVSTGTFKCSLTKTVGSLYPVLLRSWMLNIDQYKKIVFGLLKRGYSIIVSPAEYEHCHHFPNVYEDIEGETPKIVWTYGKDPNLSEIDFDFIMKDFVKSTKEVGGIRKLSKDIDPVKFSKIVEEFIEVRGNLFSSGIVLKEFVNLKKNKEGKTNEWRLFFFKNELLTAWANSNQEIDKENLPNIQSYKDIAKRIDSKFFTMDVAQLNNGNWTIIEMGDGQVSGLSPTQNELDFYSKLMTLWKK